MMLSLLGVPREDKARHRGAELSLAVRELPGRSRVFRKLRRGKELDEARPDYQDLLIDLAFWVWLRKGADTADPPLSARVPAALADPHAVTRFGGLSLGESSYLVDMIRIDRDPPSQLIFLVPDVRGFYSLPVWIDHSVRENTVLGRFRLSDPVAIADGLPTAWVRIGGKL
jgi:CRISPR-associated protein Cas5t